MEGDKELRLGDIVMLEDAKGEMMRVYINRVQVREVGDYIEGTAVRAKARYAVIDAVGISNDFMVKP